MTTSFPGEIKAKTLFAFDGKPENLITLNQSIEDLCIEHNYPAFYGGTVVGSRTTGYVYTKPGTIGSSSNYRFGTRICAAITGRFTGEAHLWWVAYRHAEGTRPNCWKTSDENPEGDTKPAPVNEVSLCDLLEETFPVNYSEARLELRLLKWNPTQRNVSSLMAFRYRATSLALRAGYSEWSLQCPEIWQCIEPEILRRDIIIREDEDQFWNWLEYYANSIWSYKNAMGRD
ncbi:hypothetical protein EDC01DRAFT_361492 [Geopyxis carbonaria]|nr:hypothetical protein EDC01DRAFT_361492 [Geopyxis carbonaria]